MTKNTGTKLINAIAAREHVNDTKLGMPSTDPMHAARRRTIMEQLAGGKGWCIQPKEPVRNAQGLTRGDRKTLARERTNAAVNETRPFNHMHSAARRRMLAAEVREAA